MGTAWSSPSAIGRNATMALAHFAADDNLRTQIGTWGALAPLASQLTPAAQPDARTRAMALSALANFSYIDAASLVAAGLPSRLGPLLFETDIATLGMALTALINLASTPAATEPLLSAGTPLAVLTLLNHAEPSISDSIADLPTGATDQSYSRPSSFRKPPDMEEINGE